MCEQCLGLFKRKTSAVSKETKKIFHHKADVKYHCSTRIPFDSYMIVLPQLLCPEVAARQFKAISVVAVSFKLKITFRRLVLARFCCCSEIEQRTVMSLRTRKPLFLCGLISACINLTVDVLIQEKNRIKPL